MRREELFETYRRRASVYLNHSTSADCSSYRYCVELRKKGKIRTTTIWKYAHSMTAAVKLAREWIHA